MAEDRIVSIFDLAAIKKEIDAVKGYAQDLRSELKEKLQNIKSVKVKMEGAASVKDFTLAQKKTFKKK